MGSCSALKVAGVIQLSLLLSKCEQSQEFQERVEWTLFIKSMIARPILRCLRLLPISQLHLNHYR